MDFINAPIGSSTLLFVAITLTTPQEKAYPSLKNFAH
jgi:hypothetical protein